MSPPLVALAAYVATGVVAFPFFAATSPLVDDGWWESRRDEVDVIERHGHAAWKGRAAMAAGLTLGAILCVALWSYVSILRVRDWREQLKGGEP